MNKGGNRARDTLAAVARIRKDCIAIRSFLLEQILKIKILLGASIHTVQWIRRKLIGSVDIVYYRCLKSLVHRPTKIHPWFIYHVNFFPRIKTDVTDI